MFSHRHARGLHHPTAKQGGIGLLALLAGAAAVWAVGSLISDIKPSDSARKERQKGRRIGSGAPDEAKSAVVGRTVTIHRPKAELYDAWRDFARLPEFLENVESIAVLDETRSRWTVTGPAGTSFEFFSVITEDRPGEVIAWTSEPDADVRNSGRVEFRDAPGGRGTEVKATIAYEPPGGPLGQIFAKMLQREPGLQVRRDLKRFKQLMETGEIAVAASRRAES
ncbi:SRPBCC family protein [Methylobrevis albus]|uniref:SRPBCC family protein n=1 Tax=Methylobrevis albus TaxID=2793297 RepID=A0A931I236_9HYPH|nr:SRPBCC family protein [Methylobrevis albus]MBH0238004.1 SRPBCC family protein [Methylobrevis albus]